MKYICDQCHEECGISYYTDAGRLCGRCYDEYEPEEPVEDVDCE